MKTTKTKVVSAVLVASVGFGTMFAGSADAAPNARACNGLNNAHVAMITAQGLETHLELNVHQVFSTKLLTGC